MQNVPWNIIPSRIIENCNMKLSIFIQWTRLLSSNPIDYSYINQNCSCRVNGIINYSFKFTHYVCINEKQHWKLGEFQNLFCFSKSDGEATFCLNLNFDHCLKVITEGAPASISSNVFSSLKVFQLKACNMKEESGHVVSLSHVSNLHKNQISNNYLHINKMLTPSWRVVRKVKHFHWILRASLLSMPNDDTITKWILIKILNQCSFP